jgi:hypothetical protein
MKKNSIYILPVIIAVLLISGCMSKEKQENITRIDSMIVTVEKAKAKLNEVNYDSIKKKFGLYKEYTERLSPNYDEFKSEKTWPYLCSYHECRKSFKEFVNSYPLLVAEIDSTSTQLNNLKHDMKNDLIDHDQFQQFCLLEKQNTNVLLTKIAFRVDNAKKEEKNFDTVHPVIVKFVSEIENRKVK